MAKEASAATQVIINVLTLCAFVSCLGLGASTKEMDNYSLCGLELPYRPWVDNKECGFLDGESRETEDLVSDEQEMFFHPQG